MQDAYLNKRLLNFLYCLSEENRYPSVTSMSKIVLEDGRRLSEPTIKNWLSSLATNSSLFYYYPLTEYRSLGLVPITVIYKAKKAINIPEQRLLPKKTSSTKVRNLNNLSENFIEHYLVPTTALFSFKMNVEKKAKDVKFFETRSEYPLHSKFHEKFRKREFVHTKSTFSGETLAKLGSFLTRKPMVIEDDFLLRILLTKVNTYTNSYQIWNVLKTNEEIWDCMRKKKRKDSVGVKAVQGALRKSPLPFHTKLHWAELTKDLKKIIIVGEIQKDQIIKFARKVGQFALTISVWSGKTTIISMYTDIKGFGPIVQSIKENNLENVEIYCES